MNMRYYKLTPQDAWFFRDGRPYNQGEGNQADAVSQFPPSPRTLTGAFRAAVAHANGWNGRGAWDNGLNAALGDGIDDLAALQFRGPFIIRENTPLWPVPLHLLGSNITADAKGKWTPAAFLRPAATASRTDIGSVRLPEIALPASAPRPDDLKPAEGRWAASAALAKILAGDTAALPSAAGIFSARDLWRVEQRVGLKRNKQTLQTEPGALYSPAFIRLAKGVALGVGIGGVPQNLSSATPPALFPFGGEGRLAICEDAPDFTANAPFPPAPTPETFSRDAGGNVEFAVVALTPLATPADIAALLGNAAAEVISACVGKPVKIGGWDSLKNAPLPLEPFHPAGSVWFCRANAGAFPGIRATHGAWLGERRHTAHGLGQILIARWPR
jgi:CRISPR-associated protein Cmr3